MSDCASYDARGFTTKMNDYAYGYNGYECTSYSIGEGSTIDV